MRTLLRTKEAASKEVVLTITKIYAMEKPRFGLRCIGRDASHHLLRVATETRTLNLISNKIFIRAVRRGVFEIQQVQKRLSVLITMQKCQGLLTLL